MDFDWLKNKSISRRELIKDAARIGGIAGLYAVGGKALVDEAFARSFFIGGHLGAAAACESGNDSNCVLLIHSNTTDGSTTFVDSSQGGSDHTADITVVNSAHHETDQQKFGTTSIYLNNGTSDKLTIADSADWDFGAGSFSLEFWVMWKGSISNTGLIGRYVGEANTWGMQYYSGAIYWYYGNGTSHNFSWTPPAADTWYHLVIARDGTNLRFFVDGIQQDSTQTDNTNYNTASALTIGNCGAGSLIDGYFDEIAIFKGSANGRTANFTPPTSAYCD